jgi:transposase
LSSPSRHRGRTPPGYRLLIKGILDGLAPDEVLDLASRRLKASREELHDALQGELTASHVFVLDELLRHIEELEARIARFDARLLGELAGEHNALALLQTLPGVDAIGAAMLLTKFQSLIVRRGYKRAIVALAHKMLRTIFFMLKRGEYYRDSATNYEQLSVQRNASRWIKALTRFGFIPAAA